PTTLFKPFLCKQESSSTYFPASYLRPRPDTLISVALPRRSVRNGLVGVLVDFGSNKYRLISCIRFPLSWEWCYWCLDSCGSNKYRSTSCIRFPLSWEWCYWCLDSCGSNKYRSTSCIRFPLSWEWCYWCLDSCGS